MANEAWTIDQARRNINEQIDGMIAAHQKFANFWADRGIHGVADAYRQVAQVVDDAREEIVERL